MHDQIPPKLLSPKNAQQNNNNAGPQRKTGFPKHIVENFFIMKFLGLNHVSDVTNKATVTEALERTSCDNINKIKDIAKVLGKRFPVETAQWVSKQLENLQQKSHPR